MVNCTNSYDAEKPDPQLVELAKYAKQHVPEEHPKVPFKTAPCTPAPLFITCPMIPCLSWAQDAPSYVEKRLKKLLEAGVVSALVCMVKQESPALTDACRECIAR